MNTTIEYIGTPSNPGTIESLLETLAQYALDPRFEEAGSLIEGPLTPADFVMPNLAPPEMLGKTMFFGNFYELSAVFRLYTDDPDLIARLTKAIRDNQASPAYQAAKAEIAEGAKQDRARREKIERARKAERIAAARAVLAGSP